MIVKEGGHLPPFPLLPLPMASYVATYVSGAVATVAKVGHTGAHAPLTLSYVRLVSHQVIIYITFI